MNKPRNCPFCGSELVNICYHPHGCHSVECLECKIRTGEYGGFQSVDVWNKRPNHDRMADEIAELREACIGIYDDFAYEEIISMSPSIFEAWNLGMKFKNK